MPSKQEFTGEIKAINQLETTQNPNFIMNEGLNPITPINDLEEYADQYFAANEEYEEESAEGEKLNDLLPEDEESPSNQAILMEENANPTSMIEFPLSLQSENMHFEVEMKNFKRPLNKSINILQESASPVVTKKIRILHNLSEEDSLK